MNSFDSLNFQGFNMSSHHHLRRKPPNGEIEHTNYLSEDIGALYLNDEYSDIIMKIDGFKINAHKVILASRSHYFRYMILSFYLI